MEDYYRVKLEQFEGPFPLLLALVERKKLGITTLSLAKVADQYLEYVSEREVSLPNLVEFLSVASRLLLLKSRAILPTLDLDDEDDDLSGEDLELKLKEYRRYREAAGHLLGMFRGGRRSYHRAPIHFVRVFSPASGVSAEILRGTFLGVLESVSDIEHAEDHTIEEVVSLDEYVNLLQERVSRATRVVFSEVIRDSRNVVEVIVSFLALLELVRRRSAHTDQEILFGEIHFRQAGEPSARAL